MRAVAGFALCLCAVIVMSASGCRRAPAPAADRSMPRQEVIVFAASSAVTGLGQLAAQFETEHKVRVLVSYGSSAALAQQIQNGAPADVFISADPAWAATLEGDGRVARRVDFLGNSLVLVVSATTADTVKRPEDLTSDAVKRLAIGDPASVPAGKFAKEALEALGLWDRVKAKVAPAMDARHALMYVERGEAEAGIVYATDAKNSRAVRVVAALDGSLKSPIRYTLVLVKRDGASAKAEECFDFLLSDEAMRGFEAAGFLRAPAPGK